MFNVSGTQIQYIKEICISDVQYNPTLKTYLSLQRTTSIRFTNDALGEGLVLERGEAQVSNLDAAGGPGDEDIVALEVPMDDRWHPGVEEQQALVIAMEAKAKISVIENAADRCRP